MDKIKLYSPLKNIISNRILDNDFTNSYNSFNPTTNYKKACYTNERNNVIIDITSFGTNIQVNPTIYLKGTNIEQISRDEMIYFIKQFEDNMEIDSNKLTITGFDFNANIFTNYPPKNYLNLFRVLPKFNKTTYMNKTGITFKNNCKAFTIYDKMKEQEKKKNIVPQNYINKNILRLELSVNEKMKQTKNLNKINKMADLVTQKNYNSVVTEWHGMFTKINKQQIHFKIRGLKKPPLIDIQNYAVLHLINEITMDEYFNQIDADVNMGHISQKQGKTRKQKAMNIWNDFINYEDNSKYDLLAELNNKVNETAKNLITL